MSSRLYKWHTMSVCVQRVYELLYIQYVLKNALRMCAREMASRIVLTKFANDWSTWLHGDIAGKPSALYVGCTLLIRKTRETDKIIIYSQY